MHRNIIFIIFITLFFFGYVFCESNKIKDFYLSSHKETGSLDWEVYGNNAIIDGNNVAINTMHGNYYMANDTINIKSDRADLDKASMDVLLRDHVKIENKEGMKLTTDVLDWQRNSDLVTTDAPVQIDRGDMQIKAKGMRGNTDLKTVNFKKDVKTKLSNATPQMKGVVTITCDGPLEVEYNGGQAVFYNNVVMTHEEGVIYSDKATAYFDSEQKTITRILCEGHVKIVKDQNVSYAQKATYLRAQAKVVLEGRPRLIYYPEKKEKIF